MRKLLSFLLLLVVVIAALPFAMGFVAKNKFIDFVHNIDKTPNVQVEVKDYRRGYRQSSADLVVTLSEHALRKKGAKPGGDMQFTFHHIIKHGPLLFENNKMHWGYALSQGRFEVDSDIKQQLSSLLPAGQTLPQLKTHALFTLAGGVNVTLAVPAFTLEKKGEGTFAWEGMTATWNYSRGMNKMNGDLLLDKLHITTPMMQLQQDKVSVTYDQRQAEGLWVGTADMNYPQLQVMVNGQPRLSVKNFTLQSESNIAQKLLGMTLNLTVDKWQFEDALYGPGKFVLAINKLDAATLIKIKDQLEAADDASMSQQQRQLMLMSMLPMLPALLDKGAEVQVHTLNLTTPEGLLRANAKVTLMPPADNAPAKGMFAMIKRVQAQANLEVPAALVKKYLHSSSRSAIARQQRIKAIMAKHKQQAQQKQNQAVAANSTAAQTPAAVPQPVTLTPAQIDQQAAEQTQQKIAKWLSGGLLIQEGEIYKVNIKFNNGQLIVNGKDMSAGARSNNALNTNPQVAAQPH